MTQREREHFDSIAADYQEAADSWSMLYAQAADRLNPLVQQRVVVDVGNGGRFAYGTSNPSRLIAVDVAPQMLDSITDPRIEKVVDDARQLKQFADGSIDVLVFILVMHHINGANVRQARETLDEMLGSAHSKLKSGGHLVILEALLNPVLYSLQCLLFPLTRFVLGLRDVSMIFFYRLPLLRTRIAERFGIAPEAVEVTRLRLTGWIDPLGGSFPGRIKIPAFTQPWRFTLLVAQRPVTVS